MGKWLFLPTGMPAVTVMLGAFTGRSISAFDESGAVDDYSVDHLSESVEPWETNNRRGREQFVIDANDYECLTRRCRYIEVYEGFDEDADDEHNCIDEWPDEIVDACHRVASLEDGLLALGLFTRVVPKEMVENPIMKPLIDRHLVKPIEDEIDRLEALIAEFRKDRVEVSQLDEPEEEIEDEAA